MVDRRQEHAGPNRVSKTRLAALLLVVPVTGCMLNRPAGVEVWFADDPQSPPTALVTADATQRPAHADAPVNLAGAIGETLSFCLSLSAKNSSLQALTVEPPALRCGDAIIPASAVRVFRIHEVSPGPVPGWHLRCVEPKKRVAQVPDVLVPARARSGGLPMDLTLGETLHLWIDLDLPKGSAPGNYRGSLAVIAQGQPIGSIDLRLTVWPFVLPNDVGLALLTEVDHQLLFGHQVVYQGRPLAPERSWSTHPAGAELDGVLNATLRLLQRHKVCPVLDKLTPVLRVDADGNAEVDWTDYDRVAADLIDGRRFFDRLPLPLWPVPLTADYPPPPQWGALSSPAFSRVLQQYLADCARHFDGKGWLARSFVALPVPDDDRAQAFAAVRHYGRICRRADERLQTLCPLFPQDMAAYGWTGFIWQDVSRYVDIWCPPAQFYDAERMQQERMMGKRSFWRLDRPPFSGSTDLWASSPDTRAIAWQAKSYAAEAVRLGPANAWPDFVDQAISPQACCEGRNAPLIYPGRYFGLDEPVPSARLKRLRRSMQDLAYLELLKRRSLGHIAESLIESLAPRAASACYDAHFADGRCDGWVPDAGLWADARRIMADELVRSLRPGSLAGTARGPASGNSVLWHRFMERTRRLHLKVNGVRVRPLGPAASGRMEVTVSVTLFNQGRSPVSGSLAFEDLPIAWSALEPQVDFVEILPGRTWRVTLRAEASAIETDVGAVRYLPLVLRTSDRQVRHLQARLAYVAANRLGTRLEVDGDLSDWPSGVGNVAEGFVLITGEDPESPRQPQTRASQATQCFVATDGQALYFGLNCALDGAARLPRGGRNYVRFEDGIPQGDELVEILLVPGNTGSRSPADLYHLVIKPYGWYAERGMGTDPPVGPRHPWQADIHTAVQVQDGRWVVEARIPLEAFDGAVTSRTVWGLNITRYDLATDEFSNWSGATRNVYDPLAAGNLALP
ncbi:MAG: hypothetical protein ACE5GE_04775 [Phycisphaerae bacterium]